MPYIMALLLIFGLSIYLSMNRIYVWLIRRDKGSGRDKRPDNIDEIKKRIHIETDQLYRSNFKQNYYDCYFPKTGENLPVIVWIHGGSFIAGDKSGTKNFAPLIADRGYAFFSVNYQWAPEKSFPSQLQQLNEFLIYLNTDLCARMPIDCSKIILGGDSAGANITANFAAMVRNEQLGKKIGLKSSIDKELKALLLFCGPLDLRVNLNRIPSRKMRLFMKQIGWAYTGKRFWWKTKLPLLASPIAWVNGDFPPTYITDGNTYSFEPQAKAMVERLNEEQVYVRSRFFENKEVPHEFQFDYQLYPEESQLVLEDTVQFLEDIVKGAKDGNNVEEKHS